MKRKKVLSYKLILEKNPIAHVDFNVQRRRVTREHRHRRCHRCRCWHDDLHVFLFGEILRPQVLVQTEEKKET